MGQLRCEIIFANASYKVAEKPFLSWRHTQLSILPSKYNLYPARTQLSVCSTTRAKKERKKKEIKKKKEKKRRRNKKRKCRDEGRALNDRETLCRWLFVHREASRAGFSSLGASRNYPLDFGRHKSHAMDRAAPPNIRSHQRVTLCTRRSEARLRVPRVHAYLHARLRERNENCCVLS